MPRVKKAKRYVNYYSTHDTSWIDRWNQQDQLRYEDYLKREEAEKAEKLAREDRNKAERQRKIREQLEFKQKEQSDSQNNNTTNSNQLNQKKWSAIDPFPQVQSTQQKPKEKPKYDFTSGNGLLTMLLDNNYNLYKNSKYLDMNKLREDPKYQEYCRKTDAKKAREELRAQYPEFYEDNADYGKLDWLIDACNAYAISMNQAQADDQSGKIVRQLEIDDLVNNVQDYTNKQIQLLDLQKYLDAENAYNEALNSKSEMKNGLISTTRHNLNSAIKNLKQYYGRNFDPFNNPSDLNTLYNDHSNLTKATLYNDAMFTLRDMGRDHGDPLTVTARSLGFLSRDEVEQSAYDNFKNLNISDPRARLKQLQNYIKQSTLNKTDFLNEYDKQIADRDSYNKPSLYFLSRAQRGNERVLSGDIWNADNLLYSQVQQAGFSGSSWYYQYPAMALNMIGSTLTKSGNLLLVAAGVAANAGGAQLGYLAGRAENNAEVLENVKLRITKSLKGEYGNGGNYYNQVIEEARTKSLFKDKTDDEIIEAIARGQWMPNLSRTYDKIAQGINQALITARLGSNDLYNKDMTAVASDEALNAMIWTAPTGNIGGRLKRLGGKILGAAEKRVGENAAYQFVKKGTQYAWTRGKNLNKYEKIFGLGGYAVGAVAEPIKDLTRYAIDKSIAKGGKRAIVGEIADKAVADIDKTVSFLKSVPSTLLRKSTDKIAGKLGYDEAESFALNRFANRQAGKVGKLLLSGYSEAIEEGKLYMNAQDWINNADPDQITSTFDTLFSDLSKHVLLAPCALGLPFGLQYGLTGDGELFSNTAGGMLGGMSHTGMIQAGSDVLSEGLLKIRGRESTKSLDEMIATNAYIAKDNAVSRLKTGQELAEKINKFGYRAVKEELDAFEKYNSGRQKDGRSAVDDELIQEQRDYINSIAKTYYDRNTEKEAKNAGIKVGSKDYYNFVSAKNLYTSLDKTSNASWRAVQSAISKKLNKNVGSLVEDGALQEGLDEDLILQQTVGALDDNQNLILQLFETPELQSKLAETLMTRKERKAAKRAENKARKAEAKRQKEIAKGGSDTIADEILEQSVASDRQTEQQLINPVYSVNLIYKQGKAIVTEFIALNKYLNNLTTLDDYSDLPNRHDIRFVKKRIQERIDELKKSLPADKVDHILQNANLYADENDEDTKELMDLYLSRMGFEIENEVSHAMLSILRGTNSKEEGRIGKGLWKVGTAKDILKSIQKTFDDDYDLIDRVNSEFEMRNNPEESEEENPIRTQAEDEELDEAFGSDEELTDDEIEEVQDTSNDTFSPIEENYIPSIDSIENDIQLQNEQMARQAVDAERSNIREEYRKKVEQDEGSSAVYSEEEINNITGRKKGDKVSIIDPKRKSYNTYTVDKVDKNGNILDLIDGDGIYIIKDGVVVPEDQRVRAEEDKHSNVTEAQQKTIDELNNLIEKDNKDVVAVTGHDYFIKDSDGKVYIYPRVHTIKSDKYESAPEMDKDDPNSLYNITKALIAEFVRNNDIEGLKNFIKSIDNYQLYIDQLEGNEEYVIDALTTLMTSSKPGVSVNVGQIFDEIVRIFFDSDINTPLDYDTLKVNTGIDDQTYSVYKFMSKEQFDSFINDLTELKATYDKLGYKISSKRHTWHGKILVNGQYQRIAGETDLIAVDQDGNVHIIDTKTTKYTFKEGSTYFDELKELWGRKQNKTTRLDYAEQLSYYMAIIKSSMPSALFSANPIELLPIVVNYNTHSAEQAMTSTEDVINPVINASIGKNGEPQRIELTPVDSIINGKFDDSKDKEDKLDQTRQQEQTLILKIRDFASATITKRNNLESHHQGLGSVFNAVYNEFTNILQAVNTIHKALKDGVSGAELDKLISDLLDIDNRLDQIIQKVNDLYNENISKVFDTPTSLDPIIPAKPNPNNGWSQHNTADRKAVNEISDTTGKVKLSDVTGNEDFSTNSITTVDRIEHGSTDIIYCTITYDGKTYKNVPIQIARNDKGRALLNSVENLLSKKQDLQLVVLTDMDRTTGIVNKILDTNITNSPYIMLGRTIYDLSTEYNQSDSKTRFGIAKRDKSGIVHIYCQGATSGTSSIIYTFPEGNGTPGVLYTVIKPNNNNATVPTEPLVMPIVPSKFIEGDIDFLMELFDSIRDYGNPNNRYEYNLPSGESYNLPFTYKDLVEMFIPYGLITDYNKAKHVEVNGTIVTFTYLPTSDSDPGTVSFNLADQTSRNALKNYLKDLNINIDESKINSRLGQANAQNPKHPFGRLADFFNKHPEISSLTFGKSRLIFGKEDFRTPDGDTKGISGLGWMAKNGMLNTNFGGVSNPRFSYNNAQYQNQTPEDNTEGLAPLIEEETRGTVDDYVTVDDIVDASDDGEYYRRQRNKASKVITPERAKNRIKRMFGSRVATHVVDNLARVLTDVKVPASAVGAMIKGAIYLLNNASRGTEYHEAFHLVSRLMLPDNIRNRMYKVIKAIIIKEQGLAFIDNLSKKSNLNKALEEYGAEICRRYFNRTEDIPFEWRHIGRYLQDHIDAFKEIGDWRLAVMFTVMRTGALRFAPINVNSETWLQEQTYNRNGSRYHHIANDAMYDTLIRSLGYYILKQQNIGPTSNLTQKLSQLRLDKEYLDVKRQKRDRVTGKPIFDKQGHPVSYTVKEAILNSCRDYDKETKTIKETTTSLAIQEMFDNWDTVKKDLELYMGELGIDYHERLEEQSEQNMIDGQTEDSTGTTEQSWDKASYETARSTRATTGIRFLTSLIKANGVVTKVNGKLLIKYKKNAFGLYEYMDSKEVLNMMLSELHGVKTVKQMLDRIHDLAQSDPMFYQLDQQINNINSKIKNKEGKTNYNNQLFITLLFNLMSSSKNKFKRIVATRDRRGGKYVLTVEDCGQKYEASQYRMEWGRILIYGGTKLLEMSPEGQIVSKKLSRGTAADVMGFIFEKMAEMKSEFSREQLDKLADHGTPKLKLRNPQTGLVEPCNVTTDEGCNIVIDSLCSMFNYIGILFDPVELRYMLREKYEPKGFKTVQSQLEQFFNEKGTSNIEQLWGSSNNLIRKKSDGHYELTVLPSNQILGKNKAGKTTQVPAENIYLNNSFVSELSEWKYNYQHSTTDLSTLVANGKTYYEIAENNTITDVTDDLAAGGSIVDDLKSFIYNFADITGQDEGGNDVNVKIGSVILKQVLDAKQKAEKDGHATINLPFQVNTLSQFKTNDFGDDGLDYMKISEREDYAAKCSILENGGLIFPTMSDKKTWVYLSGVNMPGIQYEGDKAYNIGGGDIVDQLVEYADLERLSVSQTIEQLKTLPEHQKVTNFHKGAKIKDANNVIHTVANGTLFGSFTGIYDENGKFISFVDQLDENGKFITAEENLAKADKMFFSKSPEEKRLILRRTLDHQVDEEIQHLIKIGLINIENGRLVNKGLNDQALSAIAAVNGIRPEYNSVAIRDYVTDIVGKSIVSIQEVEHCYSGHPGFFKYKFDKQGHLINRHEDEFKRFGGLISTGTNNNYEIEGAPEDGKYTCAVVNNEMVQSPLIEYLTEKIANAEWRLALRNMRLNEFSTEEEEKQISKEISEMSIEDVKTEVGKNKAVYQIVEEKIKKETDSYRKNKNEDLEGIDVADGGAYISPEMTKWLLQMCGEYNNRVQRAFEILLNPDKYDITTQEDAYALVTTKVIGAQKYTAYGQRRSEDGKVMIPYYNKMALFPVFKCVATGKFAKIYDLMLNNKSKDGKADPIHMLLIKSAVKLGDQGSVDYTTDDSFEGFNTYKQEFKYLRKQFNTNPHHKEDQSMGTQMVKVALSSLIPGREYTMQDGTKRLGSQILYDIMSSINKLTDIGQKEFRELVYDENGNIDPKKLSDFLKDQLSSRDADKSIIESIEAIPIKDSAQNTVGWKLRHPLAAISRMGWLLSILKAVIDKRMVEVHTPGNAFFQRSIWGMEGKATDYVHGINLPKDLNGGKELKMIVEEGPAKGAMECVLTIDYFADVLKEMGLEKASFNDQKKALEDAGIIGENATTNIIGYRIPTQAQSSIHALVCRDVLPVIQHNIFLPKEFTKITGSDFDIDKIYIASLQYNIQKDETGKVVSVTSKFDDGSKQALQNKMLSSYITLLTDEEGIHIGNRSIDNDTLLITDVLKDLESEKSASKESIKPYEFYTLSKHTSTKLNFVTGKTGIGPFALNNNSQILTTLYKVRFADGSLMDLLGHGSLCRQTDDDNQSIMSWISALINAHVDIAKDPYISRMNVNEMTYNLVNLLIRTGYGKRTFYFTKQPVMLAMAEKYRQALGSFLQEQGRSKWEIRNEAKRDAAVEYCGEDLVRQAEILMLDEDGNLNRDGLDIARDILNNSDDITRKAAKGLLTGKELKILQARVYIVDKALERPAQSLSDLVKYSKIDTKKQGKNVSEQLAYLRGVEKVFGDSSLTMDIFGRSNIDKITGEKPAHRSFANQSSDFDQESIWDMYNDSFIYHKTKMAIMQFMGVMKGQVFEATPGFLNLLDRFCQYLNRSDVNSINEIQQALSAKIKARAINDFALANNIDIHGLVSGNNTIYDRLNVIKRKLVADPSYADVKDNVLLNLLIGDKNWVYDRAKHPGHAMDRFSNLKFVRLFDALDKSNSKTNYIISAWDALLNDGAHPDLREFARDLCVYAFVTSGDKSGRTKLFNYVPNSFRENSGYVEAIENALQTMSDGAEYGQMMFDDAFIDDIVLNNQDSSTFVRTIDTSNKNWKEGKPKWVTVMMNKNTKPSGWKFDYIPDYPIFITTQVDTPVKFEQCAPFVKIRHGRSSNSDNSSRAESVYKLVAYVPYDKNGGYPVYVKVNTKGYHLQGGYDFYEYGKDIQDDEYMPNVDGIRSIIRQILDNEEEFKYIYGPNFITVVDRILESQPQPVGYRLLNATVNKEKFLLNDQEREEARRIKEQCKGE